MGEEGQRRGKGTEERGGKTRRRRRRKKGDERTAAQPLAGPTEREHEAKEA